MDFIYNARLAPGMIVEKCNDGQTSMIKCKRICGWFSSSAASHHRRVGLMGYIQGPGESPNPIGDKSVLRIKVQLAGFLVVLPRWQPSGVSLKVQS